MSVWRSVPTLVVELVKESSSIFNRIRVAIKQLPGLGSRTIWFNPKTQTVFFSASDGEHPDSISDWVDGLKVKGVKSVLHEPETSPSSNKGPWIRIKESQLSSVMAPVAQAGGWKAGPVASMFGGPNPLSATIASGALGAGAGYLGGMAIENIFPDSVMGKGKLRKTLAAVGGLGAAMPGLWQGTINHRNHGWSGWTKPFGAAPPPGQPDPYGPGHFINPEPIKEAPKVAEFLSSLSSMLDVFTEASAIDKRESEKLADAFGYADAPYGIPGYGGGSSGGAYVKGIDKDRFNRAVWDDPYLPDAYKGMTSGVIEGASQVGDSYDSSMISPMDIARVGIGMGTGWVSGLVVGKTLGALAGVTPEAQRTLQRAGVFAGLVKATVPRLFGN